MKLRLKWRINVFMQLMVVVFLVQCHGVQGGLISRLLPVWSHHDIQATGSSSHNSSSSIRQLLSVHTAAAASGQRSAADPAGPLAWRFPRMPHSGSGPADTADLADPDGSEEDEAAAEESEAASTFATAEDTADSSDAVLSWTAHPSTSAADSAVMQGTLDSSTTAESTPASEAADISINNDADAADSSELRNVSANGLDVDGQKAHLQKQIEKPAWCSKAQGKVSNVECWTDQQGVITGIQLTDDAGTPQPGICSIGQGVASGGGVLHEFESIVEVKACKANALSSHHGYSYMEIWTDGGRAQPITCGVMQAGSKCEVINSGKTPRWAQSAAKPGHKWFKQQGYTSDKYIINGQAYEKVSTFDPYANVTGSDPAYFREVFPLSELKATCDKQGHLSRLESACWNKQYKPKSREVLLGVKLTMDDFYTCPKKADEMHPMVCYVSDAVREMLHKQGIEVKAKIAPVECKSEMFSNTTISFIAKINALNFKSLGIFSAKVMQNIAGNELCDSHNSLACDQHGIFDWEVEHMYKAPKGVKWLQGACTPKPLPALPLADGNNGAPAQGHLSLLQPSITAPQPYKQPAVPSPMAPPPGYIDTGATINPPVVDPPTYSQPPRVPAPDGRAPVPRQEPAPPQQQSPFIEYVDPQPLPPFMGQEDLEGREEDRVLEREPVPRMLPPIQRWTPPMEQSTPFNGNDVERVPWQPMPGPVPRPPVSRGPAPTPAPTAPQMPFIEYVDPQLSVPSSDTIFEGTAPQQSPWLLGTNDGFFSDIQSPDYDDADTVPPVMQQQPVLQQPPTTLFNPPKQQQQPKPMPMSQPLNPPSQPGPRLQPVLGVPERSVWQNPKPQPKPNPNPKVQPKPQPQQKLRPQQQQQQTKQKPRAPPSQQQQGVAKGSHGGFSGMMPMSTGLQQQQQQPWVLAQPQQKPVLTRQQPKPQQQQQWPQQPGLVQQQHHHQQPQQQQPQRQPQVRPVQQPAPQQSGRQQQPQARPVQQPVPKQSVWQHQQQQPSQQQPRQQPAQQMQQQQQQQPKVRPNAPQMKPIAQQQQQQPPPVAHQVAPQQQATRPLQKQQNRRKPKLQQQQQQQQQQLWTQQPPQPLQQQQPLVQQGVAVGLRGGIRPQSGGQHLQPKSTPAQKAKQQQKAKQLTKQKPQQRSSQQGQQQPLYNQQQQQQQQRPQAALQAPGSTWEQRTVRNGQQSGHLQALQPQQQQRSQHQHTPLHQQQQQQQHAPQQHHKQHHKQIGTVRVSPEAPLPQHGTPQHQQDSGWSPTDASSSQAVWKSGSATRGSHVGTAMLAGSQQKQQQQQPQQSSGNWGSWLRSLGKVAGAFAQSSAASMSSR